MKKLTINIKNALARINQNFIKFIIKKECFYKLKKKLFYFFNSINYNFFIETIFYKTLYSNYKKIPSILRWFLKISISIYLIFIILDIIFPIKIKSDYSKVVFSDDNKIMFATLNSEDKWRMKCELSEITPLLKTAIIEKEDKYFWFHPGINPISIIKATINNTLKWRRTSGASTITMQVARLLEPKRRTYISKIIEIFRAFQLECHYSKEEILQLYLNLAPYGGNIEGIKSAAWFYLEQKPENLSLSQIITLSIIPNNPNLIKPGSNLNIILDNRNKWLDYFYNKNVFDKNLIEDAKLEPLKFYRQPRPLIAPHLSYRLISKYRDSLELHTTINLEIQQKSEEIIKNYVRNLQFMNITNSAVLIANNKTKEIVGYVGSADFNDVENDGQVDGTRAIRSPGSTLKPYLYALAIDKGLITPKFVITDVPVNYDGYCPQNFDQKYNGLVTIETALSQSLNIPAVKILNEYGVSQFVNALIKANFLKVKKDYKKLGLSIILGGCGVKLEELCNLFSSFANNGIFLPNKFLKYENKGTPQKLISEAACYLITENLTRFERPDMPIMWSNSPNVPQIAWKTGTSYGRRDAWSIGYNKNYTIAVWVGNFNGTGTPELTGANVATPLLFQLFNAIDVSQERNWFSTPKSLDFRLVCSESGLPPSEFCNKTIIDYYIPGISNFQKCQHLKEVFVSPNEKISYCRSCLPNKGYKTLYYKNYPPELIAFYEEKELPYQKIPPHNPDCKRIFDENVPKISSLTNNLEYILLNGEKQQLLLKCDAENSVKNIWWYVNNTLLKKAQANEKVFFTPQAGELKISCTDDKGRNTDIWIKVKYI